MPPQAIPPKQNLYPASMVDISQPDEDGDVRLICQIPAPNEVHVFLLDKEDQDRLSKKLAAPHIEAVRASVDLPEGVQL